MNWLNVCGKLNDCICRSGFQQWSLLHHVASLSWVLSSGSVVALRHRPARLAPWLTVHPLASHDLQAKGCLVTWMEVYVSVCVWIPVWWIQCIPLNKPQVGHTVFYSCSWRWDSPVPTAAFGINQVWSWWLVSDDGVWQIPIFFWVYRYQEVCGAAHCDIYATHCAR